MQAQTPDVIDDSVAGVAVGLVGQGIVEPRSVELSDVAEFDLFHAIHQHQSLEKQGVFIGVRLGHHEHWDFRLL